MLEAGVPFYEHLKTLKKDYDCLDFCNDENRHAVWCLSEELAKAKAREKALRKALLESLISCGKYADDDEHWTDADIDDLLDESNIKTGLETEVRDEEKAARMIARSMTRAENYNRDTDELCKRLERENRELYNALEKLDPNNQALDFEAKE